VIGTCTVTVPITFRKRGGRKDILGPDGPVAWTPPRPSVNSTLVNAIARAFRWQHMLESSLHGSISELAAAERINESYLARVLRLTLLAPDIVEAVLDGGEPTAITLDKLMKPFPIEWENSDESASDRRRG